MSGSNEKGRERDGGASGLRIDVLGPLRASRAGTPVRLPRGRTGVLLAVLAISAGQPVHVDRLASFIWPEEQPDQVRASLHNLVARLRGLVPGVIVTATDGYLLNIYPDDVDLLRFRRLVREAGAARETDEALALLDEALGLWRDDPLAGLLSTALDRDVVPGLIDERLAAARRRAELDLAASRPDRVIAGLRDLVSQYPLHEPLWSQLMQALAAASRPAEAIQQYHRAREILSAELGVSPSADLQALYLELLEADGLAEHASEPPAGPATGSPGQRQAQAAPGTPRQLPAGTARFTGRTAQLKALSELADEAVGDPGIVVISAVDGMAGVGKTALAVHWAHQAAAQFPDGQLYADLHGFDPSGAPTASAQVIRGFLDALGVPVVRIPAELELQAALYRTLLAGRRMLVVLDNARDAAQVKPLLPGTASCMVVVTSRRPLVALAVEFGARLLSLDVLTEGEATDLLSARLGHERMAAEPGAVTELAALCGRLPLALAITAARAAARPELSLSDFAAELRSARQRLDALDTGDPATSLRAALSWSFGQLTLPAADMFRFLGIHRCPDISLPAAASLAGVPVPQAAAALRELTALNLVTQHRADRYLLHDLVGLYAAEQASAAMPASHRDDAIHRVLDHYLHTSWAANLTLSTSRAPLTLAPLHPGTTPEQLDDREQIMKWFDAQRQALLAATALAAGHGFDTHAWQLPWSLASYLDRQGHWHDWVTVQRTALAAAQRLGDEEAQALIRHSAGRACLRLGVSQEAREHFDAALSLHTRRGDLAGQARAHSDLAMSFESEGRRKEARAHSEQALALCRATGDRVGQADALNKIGWLAAQLGEYQQALSCCEEALSLLRDLDRRYELAYVLDSLGYIHMLAGHHSRAIGCYRQAIGLFGEFGDRYEQAQTLTSLGDTCLAAGQPGEAEEAWRQALAILDDLGHPDARNVRARLSGRSSTSAARPA